jgi:hypothetical protein
MTKTRASSIAAALLLAASTSTAADDKLTLRVTPSVSSAPSTLVVTARVPRDAGNRALVIEADSGNFFRASEIQLDGDRAPMIMELQFPNLPGGEYSVAARLRDQQGEETIVRRTVTVLPVVEP